MPSTLPASSCVRSEPFHFAEVKRQCEHRQSVVGGRALRIPQPHTVRGIEVGRHRPHEIVVDGTRAVRDPRERDLSRRGCGSHGSRPSTRSKAALRGVAPEVVRDEMISKASLRRMVSADDIANAILFLASPLGANISGQALPVDADTQALV